MKSDIITNDEGKLTDDEAFDISEKGFESEVTPRHLLTFAKHILFALAVMFCLGALSDLFFPNSSVFEACKITLPSIATLVIGYYFGSTK
jgi:hypothetical protein